jgi:hypothetical protein
MMTDSDTMLEIILESRADIPGVPADAWHTSEIWIPIPGYSAYQVSQWGDVRSITRQVGNRTVQGTIRKTRLSNKGYPKLNVTDDDGNVHTVEVHALQMRGFEGPCPEGMQTRHLDDDGQHNFWCPGGEGQGTNLVYGDETDQYRDKRVNRGLPWPPPPPPPPVLCGPHGEPVARGSWKRCRECNAQAGRDGAQLLADGLTADEAAARLGYSAGEGLFNLAVRYGGHTGGPDGAVDVVTPSAVMAASRSSRLRARLRSVTRRNRHGA